MKTSDLAALKAQLLREQSELESVAEVSDEAARPVELDQAMVGRLSRMDAMQAQSMAQEAARRRKLQLTRIEGALRRMNAGEYGLCYVCGDDIDLPRLQFDPATTRCIECKDKD